MQTEAPPRQLGPYAILSRLGSGGMGEVYRARDTRLNRDVAVKILPGSYEEEARAISALNHPNILTLHDAGQVDGSSYLVTELVEGHSLRTELERGALPMRKVLDYGVQIAAGLAAAHSAGIVHRDLKPENVMITRDGRVKILDFGIARREGSDADTARTIGREEDEGHLIGTTAYMSPEQARGARASYFADQFALGLLLYEMASGAAPFRRETALQTLSAILTEDAPPLEAGSAVFQWLVLRCLHKEPDHRYASTTDLLRELENIRAHLSSQESQPMVAAGRRHARFSRVHGAWAAVAAAVLALSFWAGWAASNQLEPAPATFVPFAASGSFEALPAWAPNGRTLAYAAPVQGVFQIFSASPHSAQPTQLTSLDEDAMAPFWAADGSRVYFVAGEALWSVGATGGSPLRLLDNVTGAAAAPDGQTVAVMRRRDGADVLELWTGPLSDPRSLRKLPCPSFVEGSSVRFSPDGRKLAAWLSLPEARSELLLFPVSGGPPRRVLPVLGSSPWAREFSWMPDSGSIVFADRTDRSPAAHLFLANLGTGSVEALTGGVTAKLSPSAAPDGRSIAFAAVSLDYDVVRIGFDGSVADMLAGSRSEVAPAHHATAGLAYVTDRRGEPEIWLGDRAIVTPALFGEDRTLRLLDLDFSPDGRRLAYRRSGASDEAIWISTLSGDAPVRLAKEPGGAYQRSPSWSPDGNWIAYESLRNGRHIIERARVGGMEKPAIVAEGAGQDPQWSPRGDRIAARLASGGVAILDAGTGRRIDAGSGQWLAHGWSPDGNAIYGLKREHKATLALVSVPARGGPETKIATVGGQHPEFAFARHLGLEPVRGFSVLPDGSGIVTSMVRGTSDLWLFHRAARSGAWYGGR